MQQRRLRLGDILDDYCPRERRVTNHAVVAMIEDEVKQTRCTTCDADHEYKAAKIPAPRRKKGAGALSAEVLEGESRGRPVLAAAMPDGTDVPEEPLDEPAEFPAGDVTETFDGPHLDATGDDEEQERTGGSDDWPVHRPLIRATLPRPEGQVPERKATDFTIRPTGGRFDNRDNRDNNNRNGQRPRGHRPTRHAQGQPSGQPSRFGGPRQGAHGSGPGGPQGQRHGGGNRPGPQGQRGNRPAGPGGPARGPQGGGRKRGR